MTFVKRGVPWKSEELVVVDTRCPESRYSDKRRHLRRAQINEMAGHDRRVDQERKILISLTKRWQLQQDAPSSPEVLQRQMLGVPPALKAIRPKTPTPRCIQVTVSSCYPWMTRARRVSASWPLPMLQRQKVRLPSHTERFLQMHEPVEAVRPHTPEATGWRQRRPRQRQRARKRFWS